MRKYTALALIAVVFQLVGCTGSRLDLLGKDHIRMTTVDTNALSVALQFGPLAQEMKKVLGSPVDVLSDWNTDFIKVHLADKNIENYYHLMYLDPVQFCQVSEVTELVPLAVRKNLTDRNSETGLIVVPKASKIKSVKDLKDKRFAFGPYGSAYMFYNVLELLGDRQVPVSLLKGTQYYRHSLHTHMDGLVVTQHVLLGLADAGVVTRTWWETTTDLTLDMSRLLKDDLRIVAETKPMPEMIWASTDALSADQQEKLKHLLTETLTENSAVLSPLQAKGFVNPDEKVIGQLCQRLKGIKNLPAKPRLPLLP